MRWTGLAGAGLLMLALAGCGGSQAPSAQETSASTAEDAALPAPVLEQMETPPLRARAEAALHEQRLHTPAGDNAVEYYLALREREPDAGVAAALAELQPYVLISSEQALGQQQLDEARRLIGLLARMDAHAPALPRLRESLRVAQEKADRDEGARIAEAAKPAAPATPAPTAAGAIIPPLPRAGEGRGEGEARGSVASATAPLPNPTASGHSPEALGEDARQWRANNPASPLQAGEGVVTAPPIAPKETASPSATARSQPAPTALPRLLHDAAPRYPLAARNRRIEGRVQVAFTIQPDGSVTDARTVSAQPEGLFEQAALAAAARWQFENTPRRVNTTRTVTFQLPPEPPKG